MDHYIQYYQLPLKRTLFNQYILSKTSLQDLNHKKIVQNLLQKYISKHEYYLNLNFKRVPHSDLQIAYKSIPQVGKYISTLYIDLIHNNMGHEQENQKHLAQCIQELNCTKIDTLVLLLVSNNLGLNSENMKFIGKGLSNLCTHNNQLKQFMVDFTANKLGENPLNFKYLADFIYQLQYSQIQQFQLKFDSNNIGLNPQNLKYLTDALITLKKSKIKILTLFFMGNKIGTNEQNVPRLLSFIYSLLQKPTSINKLQLLMAGNYLEEDEELQLKELVKKFPKQLKLQI